MKAFAARHVAVVAVAVLLLTTPVTAAGAAEPVEPCTNTATVGWTVDPDAVIVTGATLAVPGCEDGASVGLQLITEDGDVPADAPLLAEVEDERAAFDLSSFSVRVEPVVGVRVFLFGAQEDLLEITVDQRFFNMPGNEQVGLRRITVLQVPMGGRYHVPAPPSGYAEVGCETDLGLPAIDDEVGEGSGDFTATASGVHRVCYQQVPGPPGGPPHTEDPQVIDEVLDVVDSLPAGDASGSDAQALGSTGANTAAIAAFGIALLVSGLRLRRRRRAVPGP